MPAHRTSVEKVYERNRRKNLIYSARLVGFRISTAHKKIFINKLEFGVWQHKGINKHVHKLINEFSFTVKLEI